MLRIKVHRREISYHLNNSSSILHIFFSCVSEEKGNIYLFEFNFFLCRQKKTDFLKCFQSDLLPIYSEDKIECTDPHTGCSTTIKVGALCSLSCWKTSLVAVLHFFPPHKASACSLLTPKSHFSYLCINQSQVKYLS